MPNRHRVEVSTDGAAGTVVIDGTDISSAVRAVPLDASVGRAPRVTLDLVVIDVTRFDSKDTEVLVPAATADALVALGWTPPEGSDTESSRL